MSGTHIPLAATGPLSGSAAMKAIDDMLQLLWKAAASTLTTIGGTANAITASTSPSVDALTAGQSFWITPAQDAGPGAINITLDAFTAKQVLDGAGNAFPPQRWQAGSRYLLYFDGTALRVVSRDTNAFPEGYFFGGVPSNDAISPLTVIDISALQCRSDDDTVDIVVPAMTKRIDATWAAGTGNGGLDTGVVATGNYAIYAIAQADGSNPDIIMTTEATPPSMPTGYTVKRLINFLRYNGGILAGLWKTDGTFFLNSPLLDYNAANQGTGSRKAMTMSGPIGHATILGASIFQSTNTSINALLTETAQPDTAPSSSLRNIYGGSQLNANPYAIFNYLRPDASHVINVRMDQWSTNDRFQANTLGWICDRGVHG